MNKIYSEAITEVLDILEHTKTEDVEKIPKSFMFFLKKNRDSDYYPNLDYTKTIDEMEIKSETKAILGTIYRNWWCSKEEKENYIKIIQSKEVKHQQDLREKYNPNEIFKNKRQEPEYEETKLTTQMIENYPNAYKEVYVILNNMDEEKVRKIPETFMNMIKINMNKEYEFELDEKNNLENQKILRETKAILAYMFLNYWATDEQEKRIKQQFKQDVIKDEQQKIKQYNSEIIFKTTKRKEINTVKPTQLIEYKKENFIYKFINKIKKIFFIQ